MVFRRNWLFSLSIIICIGPCSWSCGQTVNSERTEIGDHDLELHVAARTGDADEIRRLLATGVDVNSKNRYRLTALYYAADRGHVDVVRTLLDAGAETEIPNEPFYRLHPLIMAVRKNHVEVTRLLLQNGANCGSWTAMWPASLNHTEVVKVLVELRPDVFKENDMNQLAGIAKGNDNKELLDFLVAKGAKPGLPESAREDLKALSKDQQTAIDGFYKSTEKSNLTRVWARRGTLYLGKEFELASELKRISTNVFQMSEAPDVRVKFGQPLGSQFEISNTRSKKEPNERSIETFVKLAMDRESVPRLAGSPTGQARWTRFRGNRGDGIADGLGLPIGFDATIGKGMEWKTKIPGVGHSSPIIWGDRVFVTSAEAISKDPKYDLRVASGFDTHVEDIDYRWAIYCVNLSNGAIEWQKVLDEGRPRAQRHVMSSHANCTPAVDQQHVVVNLAGQGLFCLTHDGELRWKKDLGKLAAGWFMDPGYEWGFASSPVLQQGRIYLQCDVFEGAFITALNADDGQEIWRTDRAEISSWGTPLLMQGNDARLQVVANGTRAICGYDAASGEELWRIEDNSEVTVASPIPNGDHVIVTGGYQPVRPIFSIDINRRGNLTPPKDSKPSGQTGLQWWLPKGGAYSITPIIYGDLLYIIQSNGVLTTYEAKTGKQVYKQRVVSGRSGDIVASPIAADGKIYIIGGDGDVFVLSAGREYESPMVCPVGEQVMATPAAAPGRLVIRGRTHVFCFTHAEPDSQVR